MLVVVACYGPNPGDSDWTWMTHGSGHCASCETTWNDFMADREPSPWCFSIYLFSAVALDIPFGKQTWQWKIRLYNWFSQLETFILNHSDGTFNCPVWLGGYACMLVGTDHLLHASTHITAGQTELVHRLDISWHVGWWFQIYFLIFARNYMEPQFHELWKMMFSTLLWR